MIIRFSVPIFIGYLFQQIYSLVDRIIVGQFVGAEAFSAVGSTTAITSMFMSMCIGAGYIASSDDSFFYFPIVCSIAAEGKYFF